MRAGFSLSAVPERNSTLLFQESVSVRVQPTKHLDLVVDGEVVHWGLPPYSLARSKPVRFMMPFTVRMPSLSKDPALSR
jgi:hypothetical protein